MSERNDGSATWTSRFLKVASAAAAAAAVAGGLYAAVSSASNSDLQVPITSRHDHPEGHDYANVSQEPAKEWQKPDITSRHDHSGGHDYANVSQEPATEWQKPDIGWVKLNVDGGHNNQVPSTGCGGVFRDANGSWLCGFSQKLNPQYDEDLAELHAILKGLELAKEMKLEKLVVESDRESAVNAVNNGHKNKRGYHVVQDIKELLSHPNWKLVHIPKTANRVADRLATIARESSLYDLQKHHSPPDKSCHERHLKDIAPVISF